MNWYTQKPKNESESFAQSRTQFYKQFTQLQEFCDGRKSCNIPVNPKFFKGTIRQCIDRGTYRVRERFIKKCYKFPTGGNASLGNTFLEIHYYSSSLNNTFLFLRYTLLDQIHNINSMKCSGFGEATHNLWLIMTCFGDKNYSFKRKEVGCSKYKT